LYLIVRTSILGKIDKIILKFKSQIKIDELSKFLLFTFRLGKHSYNNKLIESVWLRIA
jgi:hypothetical protein